MLGPALAIAIVIALLGASSAVAATASSSYVYTELLFGGNNNGHTGSDPDDLLDPQGVAVEASTGNVFVADRGNGRVQVFDPSTASLVGHPTAIASINTGGAPRGIAIDQATGDVYISLPDTPAVPGDPPGPGGAIQRYSPQPGAPLTYALDPGFASPSLGTGSGEIGSFDSPIAIDPANGDLVVADTANKLISRYTSAGAFVRSFAASGGFGLPFDVITAVAVGPGGAIYVADNNTTFELGFVHAFDALGNSTGDILDGLSYYYAVAADPSTGDISVASVIATHPGQPATDADGKIVLSGYTASDLSTSNYQLDYVYWARGETPNGIGLNPSNGELYGSVSGISLFDGGNYPVVYDFERVVKPGIDAPVPSQADSTSVHVSAEVDPGAGPPAGSSAHFEYSSDGFATFKSTPDQADTTSPVEADITGLDSDLAYEVRAVAKNAKQSTTSAPAPFHTALGLPLATTGGVTDVGSSGAVIYGQVNPFGQPTTYHFEYGTTAAYGSRAPVSEELAAGSGRAARTFSRTISGLLPSTTYHYRIVAESPQGTTEGMDATFTTDAGGIASTRGYEQVTPVGKDGGIIENELGASSSADGSAVAFTTVAPLGDDALVRPLSGTPVWPQYTTSRNSEGWAAPAAFDPPMDIYRIFVWVTTLAVSEDTQHALVVSNRALAAGATAGAANLYISDARTGTYEFVGSSSAPGALKSFVNQYEGMTKFQSGAPDFSWVVFDSTKPLLPGVTGVQTYRWSAADGLQIISLMADGNPPDNVITRVARMNYSKVSGDGTKLYFMAEDEGQRGVYFRADGETKAISVSQVPGDPPTPHLADLVGVSRDGRYGTFVEEDPFPLTTDAPAPVGENTIPAEGGIYRYDSVTGKLLYVGVLGVTAPRNALFRVPFVSPDGNTIGFISTTGFTSGKGGFNVWHDGVTNLLKEQDGVSESIGVSRNGRYVVVELPSAGVFQVYLYDAVAEALSCVSCPNDGASPAGPSFLTNYDSATSTARHPRNVTNEGEVFFTSPSRLVAADTNGSLDVYEYQDGRRTLISPGNAPFDSRVMDISANGDDVFFSTGQQLVGQDIGHDVDIYDARVGGGLASQNPPPPQECIRDDCKATPGSGPELPFGGSEALNGPANVQAPTRKRCGRGGHVRKGKGKSRCVRAQKKQKKANGNRRQGR